MAGISVLLVPERNVPVVIWHRRGGGGGAWPSDSEKKLRRHKQLRASPGEELAPLRGIRGWNKMSAFYSGWKNCS